jgi:hypothetical protein
LYGRDSITGLLPVYLQAPSGERLPAGQQYDAVLQWGIPAEESQAAYVLNPVKCQLRAKHARSVKEIWDLNGLKTAHGRERWIHEYRIAVFQQDVLGVWVRERPIALVNIGAGAAVLQRGGKRPEAGRGQREKHSAVFLELPQEQQMSFHVRRAKRDAVRAVYALGLSTGLVDVGIDQEGSTVVRGAEPAPKLTGRLGELFAGAINRYAAELAEAKRKEPYGVAGSGRKASAALYAREVLLGADPEFVLRRPDGHFVSASRFLEKEGRVGYDAVVLSRSRVIHPLAELRPRPCRTPGELVWELYRTMLQGARLITDDSLSWLAGSMPGKGLPIGGHIHVSGIWLNEHLLRALDNYVALPLVLAEGAAAGQRRPRYGFLGDCRRKRHGGFEYRPLPSWLVTPELAFAVIALVRVVSLHYRELKSRPLDSADVQRSYYRGDKGELLPAVKKLWAELERLETYQEYKRELDAYRDRLYRLEGWDEQADFRIAWGIPPFKPNGSFAAGYKA